MELTILLIVNLENGCEMLPYSEIPLCKSHLDYQKRSFTIELVIWGKTKQKNKNIKSKGRFFNLQASFVSQYR